MSGQVMDSEKLRKVLILLWGATIVFLITIGAALMFVDLDPTVRLFMIGAMVVVVALEIATTAVLLYGQWKAARDGAG